MTYRIDPAQRFDGQVRQLARHELALAARVLDAAADAGGPNAAAKAAFKARKAIKRVRALYRTVRAADPGPLRKAGHALRDISASLAVVREPQALVRAAQVLARDGANAGETQAALLCLRDRLRHRAQKSETAKDAPGLLESAAEKCREAADKVSRLDLPRKPRAVCDVLEAGIKRTCRDAIAGLETARQSNTAADWHAFRARVKHHRMQMRLLDAAWPGEMRLRADALKLMTDALGEDHDLAELQRAIEADRDLADWPDGMALICDAIRRRQLVLREGAVTGAGYLFADAPELIAGRITRLWRVATDESGRAVHRL